MPVSPPEYRSIPIIGYYQFISNSGTLVKNISNYSLVISFIDINLTKAKIGDSFLIYSPININSNVPIAFYNNPILNVTILNDTLYNVNGLKYLHFSIKVNITTLGIIAKGGSTFLLNGNINTSNITATSIGEIFKDSDLFVSFHDDNISEITLEFYVVPYAVSYKI